MFFQRLFLAHTPTYARCCRLALMKTLRSRVCVCVRAPFVVNCGRFCQQPSPRRRIRLLHLHDHCYTKHYAYSMGQLIVYLSQALWAPGKTPYDHHGHLLVAVRTDSCCLIVFGAVVVGAVIERAVSLADRSPASLVHKVPVEAHERPMLVAFVLQERWTLVYAELL